MNKSGLRSLAVNCVSLAALVAAVAIPTTVTGAERTMLGELFTIPN